MLIKLSNNLYINPEKISYIEPNVSRPDEWFVMMDTDALILNQAHFDELMACLPTPVEASKQTDPTLLYTMDGKVLGVSNG